MGNFLKKAAFLLLTAVFLVGCGVSSGPIEPSFTAANTLDTEVSTPETTATTSALQTEVFVPEATTASPTEALETEPSVPETTAAPEHSPLYIPGLDVTDVVRFFNEVSLDAEFVNSGDASLLQKWVDPICYRVNGDPTQEDLSVLESFSQWLNTVEGFPGIYEAGESEYPNLQIYFCSQEELLDRMGQNFTELDGAVTFWYQENEIYEAIICIRTDLEQETRNSVILEEIYNGLGPIQDTVLREESIIYSGFTTPQQLHEIDELILKLIYHPDLVCGWDAEACEAQIRELYY